MSNWQCTRDIDFGVKDEKKTFEDISQKKKEKKGENQGKIKKNEEKEGNMVDTSEEWGKMDKKNPQKDINTIS